MIILINGASSTGKTYLAQKILERFSLNYYSMDHIKMGLYRGDPDCPFTPTDDTQSISKYLTPIIEGIIKTAIENDQSLTIEGCYFNSPPMLNLITGFPNDIIPISLVMSESYCRDQFNNSVKVYRNIIENRSYEEERSVDQFVVENQKVAAFSIQHNFKVFSIDKDFKTMVEDILNYLATRRNGNQPALDHGINQTSTMPDRINETFWQGLDLIVSESKIVIDRPKGSSHPKFPKMVYPVDYGCLEGTSSMDGNGIDIWVGTLPDRAIDSIICTIDRYKKDSEIKILIGCTDEEKDLIYHFQNESYMSGILIPRCEHKLPRETPTDRR